MEYAVAELQGWDIERVGVRGAEIGVLGDRHLSQCKRVLFLGPDTKCLLISMQGGFCD